MNQQQARVTACLRPILSFDIYRSLFWPQALDLKALGATKRHARIAGCSAVTGDGLLEGFDWIVNDISSRIYLFDQ